MIIHKKGPRAVAIWVGIGVIMLFVQVLLGGITRLTGSGLSITEWDIITHTVPPLTDAAWQAAFQKYQVTPQYNLLNIHFTLSDFKYIFFWEWFHRFWAQLIGIFFLIGFIYLAGKKYLRREMQVPLVALFLFGALQGAVGWIMVLSGLEGDAIYVKPVRLAMHLIFAVGLIAYSYWFFLQLTVPEDQRLVNHPARNSAWLLLLLLLLQFLFGALIAGHKAATAAPTWPDINGEMFPALIWKSEWGGRNLIENKTTIHFIHRSLAYILVILIAFSTVAWRRLLHAGDFLRKVYLFPFLCALLQVLLGIFTVVTSSKIVPNQWGLFETLALGHQLTAMLLLMALISVLYAVTRKSYPPKS